MEILQQVDQLFQSAYFGSTLVLTEYHPYPAMIYTEESGTYVSVCFHGRNYNGYRGVQRDIDEILNFSGCTYLHQRLRTVCLRKAGSLSKIWQVHFNVNESAATRARESKCRLEKTQLKLDFSQLPNHGSTKESQSGKGNPKGESSGLKKPEPGKSPSETYTLAKDRSYWEKEYRAQYALWKNKEPTTEKLREEWNTRRLQASGTAETSAITDGMNSGPSDKVSVATANGHVNPSLLKVSPWKLDMKELAHRPMECVNSPLSIPVASAAFTSVYIVSLGELSKMTRAMRAWAKMNTFSNATQVISLHMVSAATLISELVFGYATEKKASYTIDELQIIQWEAVSVQDTTATIRLNLAAIKDDLNVPNRYQFVEEHPVGTKIPTLVVMTRVPLQNSYPNSDVSVNVPLQMHFENDTGSPSAFRAIADDLKAGDLPGPPGLGGSPITRSGVPLSTLLNLPEGKPFNITCDGGFFKRILDKRIRYIDPVWPVERDEGKYNDVDWVINWNTHVQYYSSMSDQLAFLSFSHPRGASAVSCPIYTDVGLDDNKRINYDLLDDRNQPITTCFYRGAKQFGAQFAPQAEFNLVCIEGLDVPSPFSSDMQQRISGNHFNASVITSTPGVHFPAYNNDENDNAYAAYFQRFKDYWRQSGWDYDVSQPENFTPDMETCICALQSEEASNDNVGSASTEFAVDASGDENLPWSLGWANREQQHKMLYLVRMIHPLHGVRHLFAYGSIRTSSDDIVTSRPPGNDVPLRYNGSYCISGVLGTSERRDGGTKYLVRDVSSYEVQRRFRMRVQPEVMFSDLISRSLDVSAQGVVTLNPNFSNVTFTELLPTTIPTAIANSGVSTEVVDVEFLRAWQRYIKTSLGVTNDTDGYVVFNLSNRLNLSPIASVTYAIKQQQFFIRNNPTLPSDRYSVYPKLHFEDVIISALQTSTAEVGPIRDTDTTKWVNRVISSSSRGNYNGIYMSKCVLSNTRIIHATSNVEAELAMAAASGAGGLFDGIFKALSSIWQTHNMNDQQQKILQNIMDQLKQKFENDKQLQTLDQQFREHMFDRKAEMDGLSTSLAQRDMRNGVGYSGETADPQYQDKYRNFIYSGVYKPTNSVTVPSGAATQNAVTEDLSPNTSVGGGVEIKTAAPGVSVTKGPSANTGPESDLNQLKEAWGNRQSLMAFKKNIRNRGSPGHDKMDEWINTATNRRKTGVLM